MHRGRELLWLASIVGVESRAVELPEPEDSIWVRALQGVSASQVPVVAPLVQVREGLGQQLVAFFPHRGLVIRVIGTSGLISF